MWTARSMQRSTFFFLKNHISAPGDGNSPIFPPVEVYSLYFHVIIDLGHIWGQNKKMCFFWLSTAKITKNSTISTDHLEQNIISQNFQLLFCAWWLFKLYKVYQPWPTSSPLHLFHLLLLLRVTTLLIPNNSAAGKGRPLLRYSCPMWRKTN